MEATPYRRILAIDGGGVLGTFPAAVLANFESKLGGRPIGSYFDLIAGTSTGGIIALGLAMGHSASELLNLYTVHGPAIFGRGRGPLKDAIRSKLRGARHLLVSKHDPGPLKAALNTVLQDRRLGDARTRLLIPAWHPVARKVYIYKTAHHPRFSSDYKDLAVDVAMATAAAPTYFPHYVTERSTALSDGGTWANNPTALAVVEAIGVLGWPRESLRVLSLGCLNETYSIPTWGGATTLGKKIINLFMDGQSSGALGIAKILTGDEHDRHAIFRIDHAVPRGKYKMDDPRVIPPLTSLGNAIGREQFPLLDGVFFEHPAEPFVPVYSLSRSPTDPTGK